MQKLKIFTGPVFAAGMLTLTSITAVAQESSQSALVEARLEGSVATAFALNQHLSTNPIEIEIDERTAILTGSVEDGVKRDLAEQVALGIDGVDKVDNRLRVDADMNQSDAERTSLANSLGDATTTATVKSKLLWNRHTQGLDIAVDTRNSVVTLTGKTHSEAARELAARLAGNTHGVREVLNQIVISDEAGRAERAQEVASTAAGEAAEVVNDAWIASKVKSSLLFSRDLDGMRISVQAREGEVTLGGRVSSKASKELAIAITQDIRGVKRVDASQLDAMP